MTTSGAIARPIGPSGSNQEQGPTTARPVTMVLVVLDGVRWQEVFHGVDKRLAAAAGLPSEANVSAGELLPNLHRIFTRDRGILLGDVARGDRVTASGPNYVSMPGYTEIFRGQPAAGCSDNVCPATTVPTLVDRVRALPGASDDDVAVVSSWESIPRAAAAAPARVTMSAGRDPEHVRFGFDAESRSLLASGAAAAPWPGGGIYRPDALTAKIGLRFLEARAPRFLFLGLGDTDEHAHHGDYPAYLEALRSADRVIGEIAVVLDELERGGHECGLVVTTDHGRAANFRDHGGFAPESAHVWIAARGRGVAATAVKPEVRLADIAPLFDRWHGAALD